MYSTPSGSIAPCADQGRATSRMPRKPRPTPATFDPLSGSLRRNSQAQRKVNSGIAPPSIPAMLVSSSAVPLAKAK